MYVTVTAYAGLEAKTEDFDTIPLVPTGPESASLKEGMYSFESEFKFELLYEQLKEFKDKVTSVIGEAPTVQSLDIGVTVGPTESRNLRALLRNKAVQVIGKYRDDDEFIFAYTHLLQALDCAVPNGAIIIS